VSYQIPTQITVTAPREVAAGQEFEVYGYLMASHPARGVVYLANMPVVLYVDGVAWGSTYTDGSGMYRFRLRLTTPKVYTIKVVFPGYPPAGGGEREFGVVA
jgi:hypothetical protein